MTTRLTLTTLIVLTACAAQPEELSEVEQGVTCPDWMCGSNSPMIANMGLSDLNVRGLTNDTGFRLARVDRDNKTYRIAVVGGEIIATPTAGGSVIRNNGTQNMTLRVLHKSGITYNIRIAQVKGTNYWAHRDSQIRGTFTYQLEWNADDGIPEHKEWQNICSKPGSESSGDMEPFHAVVFEGDRIDPRYKVVKPPEPDWFNIGCAGHALAKLHLTGHTEGAKVDDGFVTTTAERTAMLKMLSGDYCGNGKPYTVAGVPLTWKDHRNWMRFSLPWLPIEARWTENGAACLNVPRLDANPTDLGDDTFPDGVKAAIYSECRPPPCDATKETFHLISGNP
jgi:hypothetical protein